MRACITFIALVLMTASAAGQTSADRRHTGALTASAPRASYELQLEAGQIVNLSTSSSTNLDTMLTLNGPNGRSVAQNDDRQQGDLSSHIVYVAREAGRYTAVVSGYNNATGPFELEVAYGLDVGLSDNARVLREDTVSLSRRRAEARFDVNLNADDIFVATTFALTENLDTTLTLVDARGTVLTQNDDRGDGTLNSQLIYQIATAGRYTVVASTYGGTGAGDLMVSLAVDPDARAPFNFDAIQRTPIAQHDGSITDAQPTRVHNVQLAAGQTVLAMLDTVSGNLDPVLRMNGPDGYPVAINDDRGDGSLNSAFAYTAEVAGTYAVEVTRYQQGASTGAYRLVLSSVESAVVDALQALAEDQVRLSGEELTIETSDFRLLYTLEGRDATTQAYAQATAEALQASFDAQITRLGWAAPPRDPDGRYRAYVAEANGVMGYMKPIQIVFDNPNTPNVRETASARGLLVIENDFRNMARKAASPESLMRATATHEFNHVVQHGYDSQEGLNWLYESSASWIETVTAGVDQDATDYVETDFAEPERCWTTTEEGFNYAQWTLLQSLADSHGNGIVVRLWENSVTRDGFETMSQTLSEVGTTIPEALRRWRAQNFARAYELAPRFSRSVRRIGTISRNGSWSPSGSIEQLGAHYVQVNLQGRRAYALRGDANLELVALGRRDGQIEVIALGRGGVFDASGYEYAALMVFNRAVPATPGACTGVRYSINVSNTAAAMASPEYRFSAEHFAPPS